MPMELTDTIKEHLVTLPPLTLNAFMQDIGDNVEKRGFSRPHSFEERSLIVEKLMLIVTEVAEACEDVRKLRDNHFGEELADTCIRIFDLAAGLGINLEYEILVKEAYNRTRPFKHGKAL